MIMKKLIIYLFIATAFLGCNDDFLDTENLTKKSSANFPANPQEANQALTGIYSLLPSFSAPNNILLVSEMMSDNRFGGGGQNDRDAQAINFLRVTNENFYSNAWEKYYQGIFRCNSLLSSIGNVQEWESEEQKKTIYGETSFLRAYMYFDLARMFGPVPLSIDVTPKNLPRATPDELYGQIAYDLKNAIEALSSDPAGNERIGAATKWAAQALMARVYLFYSGYYKKSEIVLPDDAGTITKQSVIAWIDDCIANSGHALVEDFRNLWPYAVSQEDYPYAAENDLNWVGDDGGNTEAVFQIVYAPRISDNWNEQTWYSNQVNVYCGYRDDNRLVPLGRGWGWAPVNPKLYDSWPNDDIRKKGSIMNVEDPVEGIADDYVWGADMQWEETGMYAKKYLPINIEHEGSNVNYSVKLHGASTNFMLNNTQNFIVIRFADVLLMGAELGSSNAQAYMDRVRSRVGLPSVPVTLENIQKERRYELAFEGVRYYDLLRWYGKEAGSIIKANMSGAKVFNMTVQTTINESGKQYFDAIDKRVRDTGGFLMIPKDEIQLANGQLEQTSGWDNSGESTY
jgi:starch-binding outer membrane protein, SusD/RagB family